MVRKVRIYFTRFSRNFSDRIFSNFRIKICRIVRKGCIERRLIVSDFPLPIFLRPPYS
jgi:hypothetical protein